MAKFLCAVFVFFWISESYGRSVDIKVTLSPTGSFVAHTSSITGEVLLKGDRVSSNNIKIKMDTFETGIGLRDKHFKKYVEAEKYPQAILIMAEGSQGKGKGTIQVKGKEKPVAGTYKVVGQELEATFPVKASDFGITDISYMGVGVEDDLVVVVKVPVKVSEVPVKVPKVPVKKAK